MQSHATIEHDGRRSDPESVTDLAHEVVSRGNIVDIGDRHVAGDYIRSSDKCGRQGEALKENARSQDGCGGRGRPDIDDRCVRHYQKDQSGRTCARASQAGQEYVQSELEPNSKTERVHRNKTASLSGAVILNEAKVLRHHIKPGAEECADN